jgi:sulfopyruvate decarboxylase TPP-binding subunit
VDAASDWPEAIHRALGELGVRQVGYVPDAGHARLIELCHADPALRAIVLTTEEEGWRSPRARGSAASARCS